MYCNTVLPVFARGDIISHEVLLDIAARARSLDDRRDAARLRTRWLRNSARSVEADFARRLDQLGLGDPTDLSDVLADSGLDPPNELQP